MPPRYDFSLEDLRSFHLVHANCHACAHKATAEDVHRYQLWLASIGTTVPTVNVSATALRFFFKVTLRRRDLAEEVVSTREPRRLPIVLSPEEVGRLLASARNIKHQALLSLAYATGLRASSMPARTIAGMGACGYGEAEKRRKALQGRRPIPQQHPRRASPAGRPRHRASPKVAPGPDPKPVQSGGGSARGRPRVRFIGGRS